MKKSSQLVKRAEQNTYGKVFPLAYIQGIFDKYHGTALEDILKGFNHIYLPWQENEEETRLLVPPLLRRYGLWISYKTEDNRLQTEWFRKTTQDAQLELMWKDGRNWELTSIYKIPDGTILPKHLSPELQQLLSKHHTITNLPDGEDLHEINLSIRFKDRKYFPQGASGLGRKILRHNWINGDNVLSQDMINEYHTIYEIRYDFDLRGQTLNIPKDSVLYFNGGSINNGTVNCQGTDFVNVRKFEDAGDAKFIGTYWKGLTMIMDNTLKWFNGTEWVKVEGTSGTPGETGKTPAFKDATASTLPEGTGAVASVEYLGPDAQGTPLYNLKFGIPAGKSGKDGKDGIDGLDGVVPSWKTFVFKQSETQPATPTGDAIIPEGWQDAPTSVGIWWMSVGDVHGETGKVTSWSTPVKATGEDGVAGIYFNFKYAKNKSATTAPTINRDSQDPGTAWGDIVPDITQGEYIWMTIAEFEDYKIKGRWSNPVRINAEDGTNGKDGTSVKIMYAKSANKDIQPPLVKDNQNPGSAWGIGMPKITGDEVIWGIIANINLIGEMIGEWEGPFLLTAVAGKDGVAPHWNTYIYAKSVDKPLPPTSDELIPPGWQDYPTAEGQWWQCVGIVDGATNKVLKWSEVVPLNGRDGESQPGKYTEFRFAVNTSSTVAPSISVFNRNPSGWTVAPPKKGTNQFMWMTRATINPDNTLDGEWSVPVLISGESGPKGDTGPAGKDGPTGRDGASGIPGVGIEVRYAIGTDKGPKVDWSESTATSRNPAGSGWFTEAIPVTNAYPYLWFIQSRIIFRDNNDKVGYLENGRWSTPQRLTGMNGLPGEVGKKGQVVYPAGVYSVNSTYVTDEFKAPYVFDPADNNFYVMNFIGSWTGTSQQYKTPSASVNAGQRHWIRFESYEAIFAKVGVISNGLIGSAVFNGDYMFSQQGVTQSGAVSTQYQNFNPTNPEEGSFIPNFYVNLKTGFMSSRNAQIYGGLTEKWKSLKWTDSLTTQDLYSSNQGNNTIIYSDYVNSSNEIKYFTIKIDNLDINLIGKTFKVKGQTTSTNYEKNFFTLNGNFVYGYYEARQIIFRHNDIVELVAEPIINTSTGALTGMVWRLITQGYKPPYAGVKTLMSFRPIPATQDETGYP